MREAVTIMCNLFILCGLFAYELINPLQFDVIIIVTAILFVLRFRGVWSKVYLALAFQSGFSDTLTETLPNYYYLNDLFATVMAFTACYAIIKTLEKWKQ